MIEIKSEAEIRLMREAGLIVADTLALVAGSVEAGMTTLDLDRIAERNIRAAGATPSFKGYRGFPATLCTSVNDEIVHGIPSSKRVLREGDIVSIDCGAIVGGYHGDAAVTVPIGSVPDEVTDLLRVCEESLWRGLAAARLGGRLRDISAAIEEHVRPHGYGVVEGYGGRGPKLVKGLVLAIEPMVNLGRHDAKELDDGWTVVTVDGSVSAHFEHTFTLTDDGPWVLTAEDGGRSRLAALTAEAV